MNKKKLCVFPNDPLRAYYEKGEIKEQYFNPRNLFEEIHCISNAPEDIEIEKVQKMAGNAKFFIHCIGKINLKNYKKSITNVIELVRKINPDIIRAYNPYVEGWLATKCSTELNIPILISLHTQYDFRKEKSSMLHLKKYFALKLTEKHIEPYVIQNATKIIVVYDIIKSYVKKFSSKKVETLYNKVNQELFFPKERMECNKDPTILSVGNLSKVKNHQCLIKSMRDINAKLIIVGKGELYSELTSMIKQYNLEKKIRIKKSIPHNEMGELYRNSDVFALAYDPKVESIPMPVMEAMSCGLPVIIPKAPEGFATGLENYAIIAERNSKSFAEKINWILQNKKELEVEPSISTEKIELEHTKEPQKISKRGRPKGSKNKKPKIIPNEKKFQQEWFETNAELKARVAEEMKTMNSQAA